MPVSITGSMHTVYAGEARCEGFIGVHLGRPVEFTHGLFVDRQCSYLEVMPIKLAHHQHIYVDYSRPTLKASNRGY